MVHDTYNTMNIFNKNIKNEAYGLLISLGRWLSSDTVMVTKGSKIILIQTKQNNVKSKEYPKI